MLAQQQVPLKSQPTIKILCAVLCGHAMLFWFLSFYYQPFSLSKLEKTPAIRVSFVAQAKSTQQHVDSTSTQAVQKAPSKPVLPAAAAQPHAQITTPQHKPLLSQQSNKKISSPLADVASKTDTPLVTPQTQKSQPTTAPSGDTSSLSPSQAAEITTGSGQHSGGNPTGEQQQNAHANAQLSETQPLSVSQVDVLKMGLIKYTDSSLQQQNRQLILTLYINAKGQPTDIKVKQSSGLDYLDRMVVKAAEKARFKPHRVNGQAIAIVVDYPFQLNLSRR